MPWITPSLETLRSLNRDNVTAQLHSGPIVPNSVMRVMADSNSGLAYLTLLYINWLALQLLPDTAETEWLTRFGDIWRPGGIGRKSATYATGTINFTGIAGTVVPSGSQLTADIGNGTSALFQTTSPVTVGIAATAAPFVAVTSGPSNLLPGSGVSFLVGVAGIDGVATIATLSDGIAEETDDELRVRVLERIRQPPVGGDSADFVAWAKATPGVNVTRAWCSPLEMGIGTVSIRFMTDDIVNGKVGFPSAADLVTVANYIDTLRPVAIKDRFIVSPIPEPIDFIITNLSPDTVSVRNGIAVSVANMLFQRASPAHSINGQKQTATTVYASWVSEAIFEVAGVDSFTLTMKDHIMPTPASLAVLGTIVYG